MAWFKHPMTSVGWVAVDVDPCAVEGTTLTGVWLLASATGSDADMVVLAEIDRDAVYCGEVYCSASAAPSCAIRRRYETACSCAFRDNADHGTSRAVDIRCREGRLRDCYGW